LRLNMGEEHNLPLYIHFIYFVQRTRGRASMDDLSSVPAGYLGRVSSAWGHRTCGKFLTCKQIARYVLSLVCFNEMSYICLCTKELKWQQHEDVRPRVSARISHTTTYFCEIRREEFTMKFDRRI